MDLTFGLGAILGPVAEIIKDKILMGVANDLKSIEQKLFDEEAMPYVDRDDELIGRLRKQRKLALKAYENRINLLKAAQ